jgi:hypothetical protein
MFLFSFSLFLRFFFSLFLFTQTSNPLTRQADITENDYRAIIDGLEDDVDLGPADDDEAGVLSVFQVS